MNFKTEWRSFRTKSILNIMKLYWDTSVFKLIKRIHKTYISRIIGLCKWEKRSFYNKSKWIYFFRGQHVNQNYSPWKHASKVRICCQGIFSSSHRSKWGYIYLESIFFNCQFLGIFLVLDFLNHCLEDFVRAIQRPEHLSSKQSPIDWLVLVIAWCFGCACHCKL